MTVYESNFIKLRQLIPLLDSLTEDTPTRISVSSDDCDLHLGVTRREPYTTTLNLTYWFPVADAVPVADPDLTVRVYHDARLAEAVAVAEEHRHAVLRELAIRHSLELGRRWRCNIMLNKWLDYLLEKNHGF
jgi:uncharacterized protein YqiB (DUF1249 family)